MASQFIGLQMVVTLRDPPTRLRGTVSDVEAGVGLTLSNVWTLDTNQWQPRVAIHAANIVDLSEVPAAGPPPQAAPIPTPPIVPVPQAVPQPSKTAFVDPAILAVGKPPGGPPKQASQPNTSERRDPHPTSISSVQAEGTSRDATPTGSVLDPLKGLRLETVAAGDSLPLDDSVGPEAAAQESQTGGQKKKKRQRQPRSARNGAPEEAPDASPARGTKPANRGKGWRETPMLQDTTSFQPFKSLRKNGAKGQANDNGWASEDVTDVQEMGDFDFEGSLAKFDKRTLFDQMRKEDQVDEADRLVSHNRQQRPKPGTAGGKNLHYSENVLDLPTGATKSEKVSPIPSNDFWNSEADDAAPHGGERLSGRDGSRQSSRRGESKLSVTRRSQSRKASAATAIQGPARVNSGLNTFSSSGGFYLQPSNRRLETVSALQMLNLENIAHNELGLTEDMMTENAGRGIAEVVLMALTDPAIKVRVGTTDAVGGSNIPPPTVVILAGNNKSGIRSIAAGRHLRNKGINVLLCVVGIERGDRDLLEDMRQQARLYKNFGGRIFTKADLFDHVRKASIPVISMDAPRSVLPQVPPAVTLIIDALLGLAVSFDELRTGDQATVYELIEWANRNEAFVLAIDVPTGIDPSSGKVSIIDGNRLYVRPRYVVSLGAPKKGLLEAVQAGDVADDETVMGDAAAADDAVVDWKLFVADMGLGAAAWKKASTKIRRGIDFDNKWVLEMRYQSPAAGQGEE